MIRFLCREIDESPVQADAPPHKRFVTFTDAKELESWLVETLAANKYSIWVHRELVGIEMVADVSAQPEGKP